MNGNGRGLRFTSDSGWREWGRRSGRVEGERKMLSLQRTGKGRQGDFPSRLPCGGVNWGKEQQKVGSWRDRSVEKAERRELTHI